MATDPESKPRILIAGGGFAGMEAALALADLAGDRAQLSLVAPDPEFVYKPLTVEEPFTHQPVERHELAPALEELGISFIAEAVNEVDPSSHTVALDRSGEVEYDLLMVCIGGRPLPAYDGVETFSSNRYDLPVDDLIQRAYASPERTLAMVVPPATSWSLPLYELALMIRRRSEETGMSDLRMTLITPEAAPLALFGSKASESVAELLEARRISVESEHYVAQNASGKLHEVPDEAPLDAGVVLALPVIKGPSVPGLTSDPDGFIVVDQHGRVRGVDDVYAAGDGTNFPVKQGGLATQQADAAAEHIAARLGADVEAKPFEPVLRGQLLTGMDSLYMKHALAGGQGEGAASHDYLWWPPQKVGGRYLSAWLGHTAHGDLEPPAEALDVTASWPSEWHEQPFSYESDPLD